MNLIEYLNIFNRKERYYLIGQLLGNSEFKLNRSAFDKIVSLLDLERPADYFSAMDYHIDWIFASLSLASNDDNNPREINELCIKATQEDVDFILAFIDASGITHLVMIEAKGYTSFSNKQLQSKAKRLTEIFGEFGDRWADIVPHFIICSPKQPIKLDLNNLPTFMLNKKNNELIWFKLNVPRNRLKVTRCYADGITSENGTFWKVDQVG